MCSEACMRESESHRQFCLRLAAAVDEYCKRLAALFAETKAQIDATVGYPKSDEEEEEAPAPAEPIARKRKPLKESATKRRRTVALVESASDAVKTLGTDVGLTSQTNVGLGGLPPIATYVAPDLVTPEVAAAVLSVISRGTEFGEFYKNFVTRMERLLLKSVEYVAGHPQQMELWHKLREDMLRRIEFAGRVVVVDTLGNASVARIRDGIMRQIAASHINLQEATVVFYCKGNYFPLYQYLERFKAVSAKTFVFYGISNITTITGSPLEIPNLRVECRNGWNFRSILASFGTIPTLIMHGALLDDFPEEEGGEDPTNVYIHIMNRYATDLVALRQALPIHLVKRLTLRVPYQTRTMYVGRQTSLCLLKDVAEHPTEWSDVLEEVTLYDPTFYKSDDETESETLQLITVVAQQFQSASLLPIPIDTLIVKTRGTENNRVSALALAAFNPAKTEIEH